MNLLELSYVREPENDEGTCGVTIGDVGKRKSVPLSEQKAAAILTLLKSVCKESGKFTAVELKEITLK